MNILTDYLELSTKGDCDVIDLTKKISDRLKSSKIKTGIMTLSVIGSTAALTTCEYEPGLIKDLKEIFEKLIPEGKEYHHDQALGRRQWPRASTLFFGRPFFDFAFFRRKINLRNLAVGYFY